MTNDTMSYVIFTSVFMRNVVMTNTVAPCKYGSIPLNMLVPSVPIPGYAQPKTDTSMGEGHIDPD